MGTYLIKSRIAVDLYRLVSEKKLEEMIRKAGERLEFANLTGIPFLQALAVSECKRLVGAIPFEGEEVDPVELAPEQWALMGEELIGV